MSKKQLNLETAQISWHELQRFFASGSAIFVCSEIDLVDVGYQFSTDNKETVEQWLMEGKICPVSDQQAMNWFEKNTIVWAIVVKPWVLVQEKKHEKNG